MKRKYKKKRIAFSIILLVIVIISLLVFISRDKTSEYNLNIKNILDKTKSEIVNLNKVRIYGTHLNISGELDKKVFLDNINSAKLVFKDINNSKKIEIDIEYDVNSKGHLTFYTSDKINGGIDLESLEIGDFIILLELNEKNYNENKDDLNYYKIINNEDGSKKFTYYTITKNNKNNKIIINNYKSVIEKQSYKYAKIKIENTKLPENVYDITIDPGHGT